MDAVGNETTGILDFPLKWSHLKNGLWSRLTPKGFRPEMTDLRRCGLAIAPTDTFSVFLRPPRAEDIPDLRSWLSENAEKQHSIFGRFNWTEYNYSCIRECQGVRFHFKDENTALYFKMAWSETLSG